MTAPLPDLKHNQDQAIAALLSERTIAAAAKKAQVSERTLYTWLDDPAFAEAYRKARREVVQQAIARLQQASGDAVNALRSIARNTKAPMSVRVSAASKILELAIKAVELEEIEARLSVLEAALKER